MALQWTPLRRRDGAVVRARQNIESLEHQTQANVLLAFKLSMVSGNGVSSVPRPNYRTYRKMADIGVQYEPQETTLESELPIVNSTVAEINTSAEINTLAEINDCAHAEVDSSPPHPPSLHRPLSVQSSNSTNSSNGELKRPQSEDQDVDAICVQQCAVEDDIPTNNNKKPSEKTEPDGFVIEEKEDSNCGLDCVYFTMQCCECTIL